MAYTGGAHVIFIECAMLIRLGVSSKGYVQFRACARTYPPALLLPCVRGSGTEGSGWTVFLLPEMTAVEVMPVSSSDEVVRDAWHWWPYQPRHGL